MKRNMIAVICGVLSALFFSFGLSIIILFLFHTVFLCLLPIIIAPFAGGIIAGLIIQGKPTLYGKIVGAGYFVVQDAYYILKKGIVDTFPIKDFSEVFGEGILVTFCALLLGLLGILMCLSITIWLCEFGCKCGVNYKSRHSIKKQDET